MLSGITTSQKLSMISDVVLTHKLPSTLVVDKSDQEEKNINSWYGGKVFYAFRNVITEGSTSLRGLVEM